jgi:hypothetical protein
MDVRCFMVERVAADTSCWVFQLSRMRRLVASSSLAMVSAISGGSSLGICWFISRALAVR